MKRTKFKIQKLPEIVESLHGTGISGLQATLIKRTENKAWYLRSDGIHEVFKIRVQEAGEMFGRWYPKREIYPGNDNFGKTAWCFCGKNAEEEAASCYELL